MSPPLRRIQWPRVQWSDLRSKAVRFGLLLAALSFACALVAPHVGLFQRLELTTEDMRLRLRGQRPVHPAIATVEIEAKSIERFKYKWPFPRDQYAVLFNPLLENDGGARGQVDLLFMSPDVNRPMPGTPISNDELLR